MSKTIGLVLALKDECSPKLKEVADKIGVTEKELKRANQSIKKFQKELGDGLKNACKTAMVGLGALATATVATVQQTMKHGDEIDKMSQKMQMSRKAYQELDYVFSQNGADISIMQTGMSKLTKAMDGAKLGTKSYILTFNRLGISLRDTKGRMKSTEEELTYLWLSKDDQAVELSLADFGTLGGLIAEFKNTIWQEKYIAYKTAIEQAETVEAVENIVIDYIEVENA